MKALRPRGEPEDTGREPLDSTDARLYDSAVGERIDDPIATALLRSLDDLSGVEMALDARCRTGRVVRQLLGPLGPTARAIGVDGDAGLLELARRRMFDELGKRAFFKGETVDRLTFGDGVFDLCLAPRALEGAAPHTTLAELARVCAPGGRLAVAHRVAGSFQQIGDLLLECAEAHDRPDVARRAHHLSRREATTDEVAAWVADAGFDVTHAHTETLTFRFRSPRAMTRDPALRFEVGPLWRRVAGGGEAGDQLLDALEDAFDVYLGGAGPVLELHLALVVATRV